jgi:hypothetical protein
VPELATHDPEGQEQQLEQAVHGHDDNDSQNGQSGVDHVAPSGAVAIAQERKRLR